MTEPTVDPGSEASGTLPLSDQPERPAEGASRQSTSQPSSVPHAGLRYTALRLAMFCVVGGILYVVGVRGWLLAVLAVLVSGIVSFFVLMRQRDAAAANLEHTVHDWSERHHRAAEADED